MYVFRVHMIGIHVLTPLKTSNLQVKHQTFIAPKQQHPVMTIELGLGACTGNLPIYVYDLQ